MLEPAFLCLWLFLYGLFSDGLWFLKGFQGRTGDESVLYKFGGDISSGTLGTDLSTCSWSEAEDVIPTSATIQSSRNWGVAIHSLVPSLYLVHNRGTQRSIVLP